MHDDLPGGDSGQPGRRRAVREQTPVQRALGLLTRREHSRKELTRKLTARGLDAGEVEAAVAKLAGDGWQDDGRFAESLVRARASGGYGPLRIRAELATHGLDREAVAQALSGYAGDWAENARELVQRRFGVGFGEAPALRHRAASFLIRRGFDADCIRSATRADPEG